MPVLFPLGKLPADFEKKLLAQVPEEKRPLVDRFILEKDGWGFMEKSSLPEVESPQLM
jgi:hypothetical protein